jgi:hypothetical protein
MQTTRTSASSPAQKAIAIIVASALGTLAIAQTSPKSLPQTSPQSTASTPLDTDDSLTPARKPLKYPLPPIDPNKVEPPSAMAVRESIAVPDRWRIVDSLGIKFPWYDPYNHNVWKGDKPFEPFAKWGDDWFLNASAISDSLVELRRIPTPIGAQSSANAGANDVFARPTQTTLVQTIILSASIIKGNTTFKPPDYEFKIAPAIQINHSRVDPVRGINIDPRKGKRRTDTHVGLQELFADVHLRNVSERFDFDSARVGIQPFISDFRGFIFQDVPFGVRVFGNRDNNRWQYNLGAFRRLEKDTNSGLNDTAARMRRDDVFVANAYRQDWPVLGHTMQGTVMHNRNREAGGNYYDRNGNLVRPAVLGDGRARNYHVTYLGVNGDGHFGRWNLTTSLYGAVGKDARHPLAQRAQKIRAGFAAAELSRDFSWLRVRGNALIASGDKNPFDGKATGFDAVLENPQFAGADTSYFIRQAVPLIGGGGVALSGRNGILPSLRSSKDQGQSNFVNPGIALVGVGVDADVTPQLRLSTNLSKLQFANTSSLSTLRNQKIDSKDLGMDVSVGLQWRPFMSQNVIINTSAAALLPGRALKQMYDEDLRGPQYSILFNVILTY